MDEKSNLWQHIIVSLHTEIEEMNNKTTETSLYVDTASFWLNSAEKYNEVGNIQSRDQALEYAYEKILQIRRMNNYV